MKLIWFCAAGYSFFFGVSFLIFAIILSTSRRKVLRDIIVYILVIVGIFSIFLSATPLALWFYIIWTIAIVSWLFPLIRGRCRISKLSTFLTIFAAFLSIAAVVAELRFQLKPPLPEGKFEKLYVIGDSVSAGIGGLNEQTWPKIFHKKYGINVIDLFESGATIASAMRQANQVDSENVIIFLEIGGNDLFGPTPYTIFEKDLKMLLETICSSKRTVVMLELPLQPWQIQYGMIQRRVARQFGIVLIPKRFFVSVLSPKGTTVDLAHLSPAGHKLMAEKVWCLLKDSL